MRCRFALALVAAIVATTSALAEPPKPAVVVQTQPVARLLVEWREMLRQAAGPAEAERLVKKFETDLKESLGEQGFEGLDLNRPLAAYVVVGEELNDAKVVMAVPVTGEKEFIAFLGRLDVKAEAVEGKKGTYKLEVDAGIPNASFVVFAAGGWAHVAINAGSAPDPKDLIAPGTLIDNANQSLVSLKFYPGRVPEKFLKSLLDDIDQAANQFKGIVAIIDSRHVAKMVTTILEEGPKFLRRYAETGIKDVTEIGVRFSWDQMTGDTLTELSLVPKAGTPWAKEIAAQAATTNRFAGLVPPNAAVGFVGKAPLFAGEIQTIVVAMLEAGQEELKTGDLPDAFHPVVDEIAKGLIGNAKKGELEGAGALLPSKDGLFTVVGGVSCNDPAAAEKALRKAGQLAALVKLFEFDVAKAGGVSIHKVPFHRGIPGDVAGDFEKVFGKDAPGYVAFAKDAVYAAYGPDALAAIKAAVEAKPGPAPLLEITGNMKHLHKFVAAIGGEREAATFERVVGTEDKLASFLRVTVEGGTTLKAKIIVNQRYLPRFMMAAEAGEKAQK